MRYDRNSYTGDLLQEVCVADLNVEDVALWKFEERVGYLIQ